MSVQITTQEQQIAELICGNTYFDAQANCKSQIKKHKAQLEKLEKEKYNIVKDMPVSEIPYIIKECKEHMISDAKAKKKELLDTIDIRERWIISSKRSATIALVINIICVALLIFGIILLSNDALEVVAVVAVHLSPVALFFVGGFMLTEFSNCKDYKQELLKAEQDLVIIEKRIQGEPVFCADEKLFGCNVSTNLEENWECYLRGYCNSMSWSREQDIRKDLEQNGGVEEVDNLIAEINNLKKRVHQLESTIKLLDKEEERILTNLKVVPAFYFQEESIKHILVYYVSKRSENITELINMYEQRNKDDSLKDKEKYIQLGLVELNGKLDNAFGRVTNEYDVLTNNAVDSFKLQNVEESSICDFLRIAQHIYNVKEILQTQDATDKEICSTLNDQIPDKIK